MSERDHFDFGRQPLNRIQLRGGGCVQDDRDGAVDGDRLFGESDQRGDPKPFGDHEQVTSGVVPSKPATERADQVDSVAWPTGREPVGPRLAASEEKANGPIGAGGVMKRKGAADQRVEAVAAAGHDELAARHASEGGRRQPEDRPGRAERLDRDHLTDELLHALPPYDCSDHSGAILAVARTSPRIQPAAW
ncbi:MAG: hypothetical protein KatS3mg060_2641 [Dehalococcoidia bacterium]|nr:MAG: hypothetical protein KatS3mg060_2641 [Dehalococcoidia bacterium]